MVKFNWVYSHLKSDLFFFSLGFNQWSTNHMIRESYDSVIRYDSANHEFESLIYFLITRITNPNLWLFDSKTESRTRILKNKSWKPNHESESSILERTESESHTESLNQKTPNPNHRPNPRYIILTIPNHIPNHNL